MPTTALRRRSRSTCPHEPRSAQRDLVALTTAVHTGDMAGLQAVLTPYMAPLPPPAAPPVAALLTMFAKTFGQALELLAEVNGSTFAELIDAAGLTSQD